MNRSSILMNSSRIGKSNAKQDPHITDTKSESNQEEQVFDLLCQLFPSYDYCAEGVAAFVGKYPNSCDVISRCDQIAVDTVTGLETKRDGIMFGCSDKFTFVGFGRENHSLFETTHNIELVDNVVIERKQIVVNDDGQIFTYQFNNRNNTVIKYLNNLFELRNSCVNVKGNFYRPNRMKFVILTIGSRGDVQPFISLGVTLLDRGYDVKIVTHTHFKDFVESHDIEFAPLSCDPKELMRMCVNNKMYSVDFVRDSFKTFLPLIPQLLNEAWEGCKDANVLIFTPPSLAGPHIAERLDIPCFNAFTMPFTYTNEQQNVMMMNSSKQKKTTWYTSAYNYLTNIMSDQTLWISIRKYINKWRTQTLGLYEKGYLETTNTLLQSQKIITLYCYSNVLAPKPADWSEFIHVTGFWRSNVEENETLSEDLQRFLRKYPNPVLISFGSISVPDADKIYLAFARVCLRFGLPVIICKGWSESNLKSQENVFVTEEVPYDLLLPSIKFMIHHGGAGTTASCVYHKKPMLIVPFFGDQFFWGKVVTGLGIGADLPFGDITERDTLNSAEGIIHEAIRNFVSYDTYQKAIDNVGNKVLQENGINNAIKIIESNIKTAYVPPTFVPDGEITQCQNVECEKQFGFIERKHHCRNCGGCFCNSCTKMFIPIPKYRDKEAVRVCKSCHPKIAHGHGFL